MKLIIFCILVGVASAGIIPSSHLVDTGTSAQFRSQDNIGNYAFGYNEDHATGGTFRRESGGPHGNVVGSYGLKDIDGRYRIVNYVADAHGFRANIQSNEPGMVAKDSAGVLVNKAHLTTIQSVPITEATVIAPEAHTVLAPQIQTYSTPVYAQDLAPTTAYAVPQKVYQPLLRSPSVSYVRALYQSPYVSYVAPSYGVKGIYRKTATLGDAYAPTLVDDFRYGYGPY